MTEEKFAVIRRTSRTIETARRLGINVTIPAPYREDTVQEQTDTM